MDFDFFSNTVAMASLFDKVDALRRFFGKSIAELDLLPAVAAMNAVLGIVGAGLLPDRVEELITVTGVHVAVPEATPAPSPVAPLASGRTPASRTVSGKKRARAASSAASSAEAAQQAASASTAPPKANKVQKLTNMPGIGKYLVRKLDLRTVSNRQRVGEAVPYEDVEKQVVLEVSGMLPTERVAPLPAAQWFCDDCDSAFSTYLGLRNHTLWHDKKQPGQRVDEPIRRKPFDGMMTATLAVGGGGVTVTVLVNGKDRTQIEREAAEQVAMKLMADAARRVENDWRTHQRQRETEREGEQRRGSARRIQHSAKEKLKVLDFFDQVGK
jgi:hypothetical protein